MLQNRLYRLKLRWLGKVAFWKATSLFNASFILQSITPLRGTMSPLWRMCVLGERVSTSLASSITAPGTDLTG